LVSGATELPAGKPAATLSARAISVAVKAISTVFLQRLEDDVFDPLEKLG
jgi:hypothetical protein